MSTLHETAKAIVANGKGILAADESTSTIGKRFDDIGVENTETNRRAWRELLFTAPEAGKYIGGVICYDETLRQKASTGTTLVSIMQKNGMIPGIKVDLGTVALAGAEKGEVITEGLDGLRTRLKEYYNLGARFAKWRAVIDIAGTTTPSKLALASNAEALACYAALCQEQNIVPIVEPEVLMDGDHTQARCREVTEAALVALFAALKLHNVDLKGILLKPNMVIAGKKCPTQANAEDVARETVNLFKKVVPAEVPGIVFLSGGQSEEEATHHLGLMNRMGSLPWVLSYSYGRALQASALKAWSGKTENVAAGQKTFIHRARMNTLAALGEYSREQEKAA